MPRYLHAALRSPIHSRGRDEAERCDEIRAAPLVGKKPAVRILHHRYHCHFPPLLPPHLHHTWTTTTTTTKTRVALIALTGVDYNALGEVVATYSRDDVYMFDTRSSANVADATEGPVCTAVVQRYTGRINCRTFLKEVRRCGQLLHDTVVRVNVPVVVDVACLTSPEVVFLGGDNFVATGGDCGNIYIWEKTTGKLVNLLQADQHVVNGTRT